MSETPENIYRRVLEIGSECLTCGISFKQLKERLTDEGYDLENDCLERCLREWFFNSFFHEEMVCSHGTSSIHNLDDHYDCNFILKSDTCLKILSYQESEKSNRLIEQLSEQTVLYQSQVEILQNQLNLAQTSVDNSKEDSKSARKFAISALIVSALFGSFGIFSALTYFGISYIEEDNQLENKLIQLQELHITKQDSLNKSINQIHNDIQTYYFHSQDTLNNKFSDK
jgi:hypothetical protein